MARNVFKHIEDYNKFIEKNPKFTYYASEYQYLKENYGYGLFELIDACCKFGFMAGYNARKKQEKAGKRKADQEQNHDKP